MGPRPPLPAPGLGHLVAITEPVLPGAVAPLAQRLGPLISALPM